ncbi:MAG: hypothetical protein V1494_04015 [Candidatus Diapherotrites archaeon]
MIKKILIAFFLLLFLAETFAFVSSQEAIDYVVGKNYLDTAAKETPEISPNVKISNNKIDYWVITILSGDTPTGFIAVKDAQPPEVPVQQTINKPLFETDLALRNIVKIRSEFTSQGQWFFTFSNATFLSDFARILDNEKIHLSTIESELTGPISPSISSMQARVAELESLSVETADKVNDAINFEGKYLKAPTTEDLSKLKKSYYDAFDALDSLKEKAIDYDGEVQKLKNALTQLDIDADKKGYLISLASPPEDLYTITKKSSLANNNRQSLDSAFNISLEAIINFAENISLRIDRSNAYELLYRDNKDVKQATSSKFLSLSALAAHMLQKENADLWVNQDKVAALSTNWGKAESYFRENDYAKAEEYGKKALSNATDAYKDGFNQPYNPPVFSTDLLLQIAAVLAGILALLFVWRNRDKIISQGGDEKGGETVDVYGWNKKI